MLIAHVFFNVNPPDRQDALDALLDKVPTVREMAGCKAYVPFADPTDPAVVAVLHEWEDADAFKAYLASPGFIEVRGRLGSMMTGAPVSKRFVAEPLETVN